MDVPGYFLTQGCGPEFEADPIPSNRLGSSIPYSAFSTAPCRNATQAVAAIVLSID
jgi:hypothetical protein